MQYLTLTVEVLINILVVLHPLNEQLHLVKKSVSSHPSELVGRSVDRPWYVQSD